jgi:hypothetical protein
MNTKYKRHDKVKLLRSPQVDDIEPYGENFDSVKIKKGMTGEINIILPNGNYHVLIRDKKGNKLAYVVIDEESLEAL